MPNSESRLAGVVAQLGERGHLGQRLDAARRAPTASAWKRPALDVLQLLRRHVGRQHLELAAQRIVELRSAALVGDVR